MIGSAAIAVLVAAIVVASAVIMTTQRAPGSAERPPTGPTPAVLPGPSPDATPVDGSEVLPPVGDQRAGVPRMTAEPPDRSDPPPEGGAADGRLVDGFPTDIAGPADGDTVLESSVASEGAVTQISLTARTQAGPDAVRERFRDLWTAGGLAAESGGDEEITYRGASAVFTLTVATTGTGTVYSVFGVLRAG